MGWSKSSYDSSIWTKKFLCFWSGGTHCSRLCVAIAHRDSVLCTLQTVLDWALAQSSRMHTSCDVIIQKMFREIVDQKHPLHYLLSPVKVSNSQMVLRPTDPYQLPLSKVPVMDKITSHTAYQRSFRLFQIRPIIVIVSIVSIITVCVCVCFNLLSDNESNTIRVIWYFVMLYCLLSFQP